MNRNVVDFLLQNNIFETIMTATRGPDNGDIQLKRALTAPLRWTIGFGYGSAHPPKNETFAHVYDEGHAPSCDNHFVEHAFAAFSALRRKGWDLSRVPLTAYFDPIAARDEAIEILCHAISHVAEDNDTKELLTACLRKCPLRNKEAAADPNLKLTL
jgi:hypothetical protein